MEGRHYCLLSIGDFSNVKVFGDAANRTAVAIFELDKLPNYPATYFEWASDRDRVGLSVIKKVCQPIDKDDLSSPILHHR